MKARSTPIDSEEQWRALRRTHCGGSEIGALFGESSYLTAFELWHQKKGLVPEPDLSGDDRVFFGRILEQAIVEAVRQQTGWTVHRSHRYYSLQPELGLGGTPDADILAHERGPGILECKNIDSYAARAWDGIPPLSFELQIQTYLELTDCSWACLAVLVGGNSLKLYTYERRPRAIAIIKDKVKAFWASIEAGEPPEPNFQSDADTISTLYRAAEAGKVIDLTGDAHFAELVARYEAVTALKRQYEREARALRAELLTLVGDAELALCGDVRLRASASAGSPPTVITQEMIGQSIGGREGYRVLTVSHRQERAA